MLKTAEASVKARTRQSSSIRSRPVTAKEPSRSKYQERSIATPQTANAIPPAAPTIDRIELSTKPRNSTIR